MATRVALKFMKQCYLYRKLKFNDNFRHSFSAAAAAGAAHAPPPPPPIPKKVPHFSKKGRLFTGAAIGLLIGGGAYASTVDEATFWRELQEELGIKLPKDAFELLFVFLQERLICENLCVVSHDLSWQEVVVNFRVKKICQKYGVHEIKWA